eukprot:TRINITY_DN5180_c0_g1_i6.p1 TRINITY_DN5180_c0_g1~~TRINITY_DN5180_c0_g1_i6.p1  ORF type:complete len:382 (+),score=104.86 TRINITY_DN5180_c0_g1_i6:338-1483(+)
MRCGGLRIVSQGRLFCIFSKRTHSDVKPFEGLVPASPQAPPASPQAPPATQTPPASSQAPRASSQVPPVSPLVPPVSPQSPPISSHTPQPQKPAPSPQIPFPSTPTPPSPSPAPSPYIDPFPFLTEDQTQLDSIIQTITDTFTNSILPNFEKLKAKINKQITIIQRLEASSLQTLKTLIQNVTGDIDLHVRLLEEVIEVRRNGGKYAQIAQNCEKLLLSLSSQKDDFGTRAAVRVRAVVESLEALDVLSYGDHIGMAQHPLALLQFIFNYYCKIVENYDPHAFKISEKDCLGCIFPETYRCALFKAAECHAPLKGLSKNLEDELKKFSSEISQFLEPLHIISGYQKIDDETWLFTSSVSHKKSVLGNAITLLLQFIANHIC